MTRPITKTEALRMWPRQMLEHTEWLGTIFDYAEAVVRDEIKKLDDEPDRALRAVNKMALLDRMKVVLLARAILRIQAKS